MDALLQRRLIHALFVIMGCGTRLLSSKMRTLAQKLESWAAKTKSVPRGVRRTTCCWGGAPHRRASEVSFRCFEILRERKAKANQWRPTAQERVLASAPVAHTTCNAVANRLAAAVRKEKKREKKRKKEQGGGRAAWLCGWKRDMGVVIRGGRPRLGLGCWETMDFLLRACGAESVSLKPSSGDAFRSGWSL